MNFPLMQKPGIAPDTIAYYRNSIWLNADKYIIFEVEHKVEFSLITEDAYENNYHARIEKKHR